MDLILAKKRVLLLVSGGIAIYKSLDLISNLKKEGAEVFVVMSEEATRFIAPLTFEAMSGNKVLCKSTESFPQISHISYANIADIAIIAPATINSIAKLNHGIADNLIVETLLACKCEVFIAPSANVNMMESSQNRANLDSLKNMGYKIIPPRVSLLACDIVANGAMAEVGEIIFQLKRGILSNLSMAQSADSSLRGRIVDLHEAIHESKKIDCHESLRDSRNDEFGVDCHDSATPNLAMTEKSKLPQKDRFAPNFWNDKNIVITGGGSVEAIDSIRHISNDSSGKQASNLALAFYYLGANVSLIASKFPILLPLGVEKIAVKSSADFKNAIQSKLDSLENRQKINAILLMAAAISDFVPKQKAQGKLKKEQIGKSWDLHLTQNEDILWQISNNFGESCYIVGFKAESFGEQITPNAIKTASENAKKMLKNKHCDMVVLNIISQDNEIGGDSNAVRIFTAQNEVKIPQDSKLNISFEIAQNIAKNLSKK